MTQQSKHTAIADAAASPISFERIAAFPPPGWHVPREVRFSPDGKLLSYLKSESRSEDMALFVLDLASGQHRVLVRAKDLAPEGGRPMSREEELRRERQRQRLHGITNYQWAAGSGAMLLPVGGDVFVRLADGTIRRLTESEVPEIDPQLCPSGKSVAFARGRELYVVDIASGEERALTTGAPEGVTRGRSDFNGQEEFAEPSGLWWSPACDAVAYLEVDERGVEQIPVLGYRGEQLDLMHQRYPRSGQSNPTTRLGVVGLTGSTTWIDLPRGEHYLGRLRWAPDGKSLYVQLLARDQRTLRLVRADVGTGAATELLVERDPAWVELSHMVPLPGGRFVWAGWRDGHRHLELRDGATGAHIRALTAGAWDVFDVHGLDARGGRVLFTANRDAVLDRQLYAVTLDGAVERLTTEPGVHDVQVADDGQAFFDLHSANDRLPQAVVKRANGEVLGELEVPLDDDFDVLRIRPAEAFTVPGSTAPGGEPELHGALLRPRNMVPGARYPLIVMVYGGPGVQTVVNEYNPRLLWQHLADRGFVVMQVDNRGSTGRGHAFEAELYRRLGTVELADQLRALDHVAAMPFVDPARVGIYGHSYGGYLAALAMLQAPKRFKVGVSGSPVSDWRLYDTGYTERYMSTPEANPEGYERSRLAPLAGRLEGKLLVVHALMDENVHFEHSARLIDALVAADKDFDMLVFPGERHGYRSPEARRYAYRRVVGYFADHL